MRPIKPSPFFRPRALDGPAELRRRPRLTHAGRRIIAWCAGIVLLAIAVALAVYLAYPERRQRPARPAITRGEETSTKAMQREPGVVDMEIQRGKDKRTYRFHRVGKDLAIEEVTPKEKKKTWWDRLWGR